MYSLYDLFNLQPTKTQFKKETYQQFFKTLGKRFIAGGDFNAKHTDWGSRLITPKGRQLLSAIQSLNLNYASTGEPTYWPTDTYKVPDLIDFFITKSVSPADITCKSSYDLSSDHSPIIDLLGKEISVNSPKCQLSTNRTNWYTFKELVTQSLDLKISLKINNLIETVEHFNTCIQEAAWSSPPLNCQGA